MSAKQIKQHCSLDSRAEGLLHQAMAELNISARGYNKVLKAGRTIADIDHSRDVHQEHTSRKPLNTETWIEICGNNDF
jgi:magnesium chelatase family protein